MEDRKKARIRNTARIVIIIGDLLLFASLAALLIRAVFTAAAPDVYTSNALQNSNYALHRAFWDFLDNRPRELAAFIPPDRPDDLQQWADGIARHMRQPAAVFLRDNGDVRWFLRPPSLERQTALLEAKLARYDTARSRGLADTLGQVVIRFVPAGMEGARDYENIRYGYALRRLDGGAQWGVMFDQAEAWRPFLAPLVAVSERDPASADLPDPLAERLRSTITVGKPRVEPPLDFFTLASTLRVFLDGDELFRSPGLDTTQPSLVDTMERARLEFYLSKQDRLFTELAYAKTWSWVRFGVIVVLLIVLHLNWLLIKRLTAPETVP